MQLKEVLQFIIQTNYKKGLLLTEGQTKHVFPLGRYCLRRRFDWAENNSSYSSPSSEILKWLTWTKDNRCHNEAMVCSSWHFVIFLVINLISFKRITIQSPHFNCWDYCQKSDSIYFSDRQYFLCLKYIEKKKVKHYS